jgi:pimeloyl-ACP methyl ester carboxylesterase
VTSHDGTRLAVAIHGSGPATVLSTLHINDKIDAPGVGSQHWIRLIASSQRIARFDSRGCGLSARDVGVMSVERCVEDLHAVVDSLGSDPVNLIGLSHGSPIALRYAASRPERVERLVLYGGYLRGRLQREQTEAQVRETKTIAEAVRVAFSGDLPYTPSFRRALSLQFWPSASLQQLDELDPDIYAGRIQAETAAAYTDLTYQFNLDAVAPTLSCPTMVFHARRDRLVPFDEGSRLAALIPGARFVPLEADNHLPLDGDPT